MSFPINVNIPATNNDPADDQPLIRQNFANISNYLTVDHVQPGQVGDGFHKQVTYFSKNTPAVAPTDPESISFTATASTLTQTTNSATPFAQEFYQNQNGIFLTNPIRAFARFTVVNAGVVTITNAYNVASITSNAARTTITVNLVVGATNGTTFSQISNRQDILTSANITANTITFNFNPAFPSGDGLSFIALQV